MRYAEMIVIALAIALAASGRAIVNLQGERVTQAPTFTAEATETPGPECPEGEFHNAPLGRCWPIATQAPDIEATEILDAEVVAVSTYETPAVCGWYVPDYPATPPPTPHYVCNP